MIGIANHHKFFTTGRDITILARRINAIGIGHQGNLAIDFAESMCPGGQFLLEVFVIVFLGHNDF
jgi:hypothetical protein